MNRNILPASLFATLSFVYFRGHCPTFGPGDSPQHVLSALTWGVSHAPGYPLYTALAHAISRLPFGTPTGNVNAFSGFLHALAATLFFLILRRQKCHEMAALTATALLAFSPLYWFYSEVAEVRALNDVLALASLYLAVVWRQEGRPSALTGLAATLGLGIGHHPTFLLMTPAIAYLLWMGRNPSPWHWARFMGVIVLMTALPYVLLKFRLHWPAAYNYDNVKTWRDVAALFLRRETGGFFHFKGTEHSGFDFGRFQTHCGWFLRALVAQPTPPGLLLAGLGIWSHRKNKSRETAALALWFLGTSLIFLVLSSQEIPAVNPEYVRAMMARFYLLPLLPIFLFAGWGLDWLQSRVRPGFMAVLALAALSRGAIASVDLSRHDPTLNYARRILSSTGASDMIILAADDSKFAMIYLDIVEHAAGDRVFLMPPLFPRRDYYEKLKRRHPTLNIPLNAGRISVDWKEWARLNPERRLNAEPILREALRPLFPREQPRDLLVCLSCSSRPASLVADERRFSDYWRGQSAEIDPSTQEIYLLENYAMQAEWYKVLLQRPNTR